jgi:hypothetical protein
MKTYRHYKGNVKRLQRKCMDTTNESVWTLQTKVCGHYKRKCVDTTNESVWTLQMKAYGDCNEDMWTLQRKCKVNTTKMYGDYKTKLNRMDGQMLCSLQIKRPMGLCAQL